jgi:hypothetical protein
MLWKSQSKPRYNIGAPLEVSRGADRPKHASRCSHRSLSSNVRSEAVTQLMSAHKMKVIDIDFLHIMPYNNV